MNGFPVHPNRSRGLARTGVVLVTVCTLGFGGGGVTVSVAAGTSPTSATRVVAVLGDRHLFAGHDGKGWGTAHPSEVYNGGDGGGLADHLHWRGWGAQRAYAHGKTSWYTSTGTHRVRDELRASDLGSCFGKPAYRRLYERDRKVSSPHRYSRWFPWLGRRGNICQRDLI